MNPGRILRSTAFALLAGTAVAASAGPAPITTILLDQNGALAAGDPVYNRVLAGNCGALSGTGTAVHYKTYTITATAGVPLYVTMSGFEGVSSFDTFITLYSSFDPNAPTANCIGADDDSGVQTDSHLEILNPVGGTYTVVAASFFNDAAGDYRVCATQGTDALAACLEVRRQIPTLSEWSLGGLAVLMGLFGTWAARRRRS